MNFTPSEPSEEKKNTPNPTFKEDGSYEIIFDTDKKSAPSGTAYSTNGYNAYGFSANGSSDQPKDRPETPPAQKPPKKKRGSPVVTALLIVTTVLLLLSVGLTVAAFVLLDQSETTHSIGTKPENTGITEPWTNPYPLDSEDAYANATERVINSVVIVEADTSLGSGVIWASGSDYSYVITCAHVIDGAANIEITLYDGESYYADVVGSDSRSDIAVLRIGQGSLTASVLPHEDSDLSLGQAVIAIGNPLGTLGHSVTNGILSSLSRVVTVEGATMELIQTNAAVNHGNSGGGLFDLNGQLIGLVNAKVSQDSVEGIGFAIPFFTLKQVAGELIEKGYVSGRPSLGITAVTMTADNYKTVLEQNPDLDSYASSKNYFGQKQYIGGVYVVDASSVQYTEGSEPLLYGDRLMTIGTTAVTVGDDVTTALNSHSAGDTVKLTVSRKGNQNPLVIEIILGEVGQ